VNTNTVEGYLSIFKCGMRGIYQHRSEKHLHRYLAEFNFRYSNRAGLSVDASERATLALKGIVGKRLTYGGLVGRKRKRLGKREFARYLNRLRFLLWELDQAG
jgi:hypothetical protein